MTDPIAITAERLRLVCPRLTADQAEVHAQALEAARPIASLNMAARVRHFVAQCAHETGQFRRLTENLNYRDPAALDRLFRAVRGQQDARMLIAQGPQAIANRVYADRGGNGDEQSGDGWRYRGRGYLQITLHDNYAQMEQVSRLPLKAHPELLEDPHNAAVAAAHFWRWHGINGTADRDDTRAVTAHINPALAGLDDRIAMVGLARKVWP
ncbi:glycoside hydrolase family 19 protein [Phenylobacterium sp.]|uniref:glycoside hydrolase family 19 protein n=1 Tax=Phenylobacterium sp. TaxID=1871053 RepID=UPI0035B0874E